MELVCQHFTNHHRNDDEEVFEAFIKGVCRAIRRKHIGSPYIWKTIYDMVVLHSLRFNRNPFTNEVLRSAVGFEALGLDPKEPIGYYLSCLQNSHVDVLPSNLRTHALLVIVEQLENEKYPTVQTLSVVQSLLDSQLQNIGSLIENIISNCDWEKHFSLDHDVFFSFLNHAEGRPILKFLFEKVGKNHMDWFLNHYPFMSKKDMLLSFNPILCYLNRKSSLPKLFFNRRLVSFFDLCPILTDICLTAWYDSSLGLHGQLNILAILSTACNCNVYLDITEKLTKAVECQPRILRYLCSCLKNVSLDIQNICKHVPKKRFVGLLHANLPQYALLSMCSNLVENSAHITTAFQAMAASGSFVTAAEFFREHFSLITHPSALASSVKFFHRQFLNDPNALNFEEFKTFFISSNPHFMRRILRLFHEIPNEYLSCYILIIWTKIHEVHKNRVQCYTNIFLSDLKAGHIRLIQRPVLEEMSQNSQDAAFLCLTICERTEGDWVKLIISHKCKEKWLMKVLWRTLLQNIIRANSSLSIVERILVYEDELIKEGNLPQVYQLHFLRCFFTSGSNLSLFAQNLIEYFASFSDFALRFPMLGNSLTELISFLPSTSLLLILSKLVLLSQWREEFVALASFLPNRIPLDSPFVRNKDIQAYNIVLEKLRGLEDNAVDAYIYHHFHNRFYY